MTVKALSTALLIFAALVNLAPVSGVLSADRLQGFYGVAFEDDNLLVLMRHRALLFGVVGGILAASVFHSPLRPIGLVVGLFSMLSFVLVTWLADNYNAELGRIAIIDLVASVALAGSALIDRFAEKRDAAH